MPARLMGEPALEKRGRSGEATGAIIRPAPPDWVRRYSASASSVSPKARSTTGKAARPMNPRDPEFFGGSNSIGSDGDC
jgi:hypothetical protein